MNTDNIIELEEKLHIAMLNSDVNTLDKLISDDLIFTGPNGELASKQMDLDCHKSGIQKMTELKLLEQKIKIYDNFAIVFTKMQIEGSFNGINIDGNYSYTRIWSNNTGNWQIVGGHVSKTA